MGIKGICSAFALFLGLCLVLGCGHTAGSKIVSGLNPLAVPASDKVLRIGIAPNSPPLIFKRNGKIVGLEADMAYKLSEQLGREPIFVEMAFTELIPSLMKGQIDIIMSGMSITDQRAIRVAFTRPYLSVGQLALVRNEDISKYDNVGILVGKCRIGVEEGTTGALFVERNCRQAKVKTYSSADKAAKALIAGRVDAVIHDAPTIWWLSSIYETQGLTYQRQAFTQELIAWGLLPENDRLFEQVEGVLSRWDQDGTVDRLCRKWLPDNNR
jgi:ABC-type amino acid transport substrate-binding protein